MAFQAIEDVCEFKKGDIVPEERGRVWHAMYLRPPVVKIAEEKKEKVPEVEKPHVAPQPQVAAKKGAVKP